MLVRLTTPARRAGEVVNVSVKEAARLIREGLGVPLRSQPIERAVIEPPEVTNG